MSDFADLPIRDELRGVAPYGAPQLDVAVRLNTNENPHPPNPETVAAISAAIAEVASGLQRYPDRNATVLRALLAEYLMESTGAPISEQQVWAANGSNEILQQICQAFGGPGRSAMGFEPTYSMHRIIARGTGTAYVEANRETDFSLSTQIAVDAVAKYNPDIVFVCSPNNPTGQCTPLETIEEIYEATNGVVIVDEAYAEFTRQHSAVNLLPGRKRLLVTRTMSKAFAFAGARVGYLVADPEVIEAMLLVRLPYHLSALTQAAAIAAIEHRISLMRAVDDLKAQRDRIAQTCRELGCVVVPSDANFVLIGGFADSSLVWQQLVDRGILVRDVGLPGYLRVTAGTASETDAFLSALSDILEQHPMGQETA